MKKAIPVIIALFLIFAIGGGLLGKKIYDKYSYSKERLAPDAYFRVSGEECAIILQDARIEEKAIVRDGVIYLDLPTVHKYLNEIFYEDRQEGLLLYTTATEVISAPIGGTSYTDRAGSHEVEYTICYVENDVLYLALEYVKQFTNFSYEKFDEYHIQVYTEWGDVSVAEVKKATAVREKGGVKSPILRDLAARETVEILEEMETWSKVKTSDSYIGYVENKFLINYSTVSEIPANHYTAPEYTSIALDGKVCLGWHAIAGVGGNSTLGGAVAGTKGMNVIAPTWFSLNDEEGNFRSFGEASYVIRAHEMGLQVWGVLDDFNYNNEKGLNLSVYNVLSSTAKRQYLANGIAEEAVRLGLDGINLDFERVQAESGPHFVQFLRELSILCRENGLVLSVDNYVPFNFNNYYRLDVQGQVADYVIIMGYDEHWSGSGDPGSVASLGYVRGGIERTLQEVPAHKVVNGLPLYTIEWRIEGAKVTDNYLTMNNQADYLARIGVKPQWDEETSQNYVEYTSGNAVYQMWLEDLESISAKLNVMMANDIAGMAVWQLEFGTPEVWELFYAYVNS